MTKILRKNELFFQYQMGIFIWTIKIPPTFLVSNSGFEFQEFRKIPKILRNIPKIYKP